MGWYIEVVVKKFPYPVWKKVRPSQGLPYYFDTEEEARKTADMCYGGIEHADEVRVIQE